MITTSSSIPQQYSAMLARAIARNAWQCREAEPVAAFRWWTLAGLLMKRAHRAASIGERSPH